MYSVFDYGSMLADPRADCYAEALRRAVRPGDVVVDLGAGTGIWAAYACALGARRVFAIEPGEIITLAREMARHNGLDDRITFIQAESHRVSIDEPANVVVADIRGVLPFDGTSLRTMADARNRFLAPGGELIPGRDAVWVSVVHAPAAYRLTVAPWDERCFGIDFSPVRHAGVNRWRKERFVPDDLVASPAVWAEVDYRTVVDPSASGSAKLIADRAATAHGLVAWFESELIEGVRMSNRPGAPPLIYGQGFFPFPSPVELAVGDAIDVHLRATLVGTEYVFRWETSVRAGTVGPVRAQFVQSTFDSATFSLDSVHPYAAEAIVTPGRDGEIDAFVLGALDGSRSQGEIAAALAQRFPDDIANQADAMARVAAVGVRVVKDGGQVRFRD